jgi:hypothetical protein
LLILFAVHVIRLATGPDVVGVRMVLNRENVPLPLFATALCVTTARPAAAPPAGGGAELPPLELAPPIAALTCALAFTVAVTSDAEARKSGIVFIKPVDEKNIHAYKQNA